MTDTSKRRLSMAEKNSLCAARMGTYLPDGGAFPGRDGAA